MMNLKMTRNTTSLLGSFATVLAISVFSLPAYSAIALDRTRVIFDGDQRTVSLNISNQNEQLPYLAQGWIEDEDGKKIQSPFTVLPPVQRVEPGKSSQVKIQSLQATRQLPQDRETLFYFNLREIPPRSNKPNTLQIALQTRIKMFYRPSAIALEMNSTPWQEQLSLTRQENKYVVNNPTAYYVTVVEVKASNNGKELAGFEPLMVAPKASAPLNVPVAALGNSPVLVYINDYGGRPQLNFHCTGNTCQVMSVAK